MTLTALEAHFKCHAQTGSQTCRYLLVSSRSELTGRGSAFRCAFVAPVLRSEIDERFLRGYTRAKAGPCANPHDQTTASVPATLSRN